MILGGIPIKNLGVLATTSLTNTIIGSSIDNVLIVYQKTTKLMLYRFLNSLALLLIIVVVQVLNLTFSHYMMLFVIVQVSFALWIYGIVGKLAGRIRVSIYRPLVKTILPFSIPLGFSAILGTVTVELDKLMIGHFMGTESLALYTNSEENFLLQSSYLRLPPS